MSLHHVHSPRRVTVVAHELRGFLPVGGMGTATTNLALALARMGHDVEILLGIHSPDAIDPYWQTVYADAGIRIRAAPTSGEPVEPWHFVDMHNIELGLRAAPPEVVIAPDFGAPAYTALRVRQTGLAFEDTLFVIFSHGSWRYAMDVTPTLSPRNLRDVLAFGVQEQASIELADVVVSPSSYLVEWMRNQGWRLPEETVVIPYFTRATATGEDVSPRELSEGERLRRITFFGRVDERKGLKPFAAGLNALEPELLNGLELEFLGKTSGAWPRGRVEELLSERTRHAIAGLSFETELDQHEAIARLSQPGTLVVMPSLRENSPNAVYECLEHGIPFIASNVGGVPELIAADDHPHALFEPTQRGIEAALRRIATEGEVPPPPRPAYPSEAPYMRWSEVVQTRRRRRSNDVAGHVDVVVVLRTSRDAAARCLSALERQTYTDLSVIVVEGETVEAARTTGLRSGAGPYIVFLDEKDVPDEDLVRTLVHAQRTSEADVVTCGIRIVGEQGEPTLHLFSGEPHGLGALSNAYGSVALFRREVLADVTSSWPAEDADWPLLAALSTSGARILSIPVPLVTRDSRPGSIERNASDALLVVEQLERALPDPIRTTARLAAGLAARSPPAPVRAGFVRRAARRLRQGNR